MKAAIIINDPPYGTERVYNALRLAHALQKKGPEHEVTVFLMADAVTAAKRQPINQADGLGRLCPHRLGLVP